MNQEEATQAITLASALSTGAGFLAKSYGPKLLALIAKKSPYSIISSEAIKKFQRNIDAEAANLLTKGVLENNEECLQKAIELKERSRTFKQAYNRSKIYESASETIEDNKVNPDDERLSDEWLHYFDDLAGSISDEQAQFAWGKVLSQEVRHPGTISKATLDVLKGIDYEVAGFFQKIAKMATNRGIVHINENDRNMQTYGLGYSALLKLDAARLIHFRTDEVYQMNVNNSQPWLLFHDELGPKAVAGLFKSKPALEKIYNNLPTWTTPCMSLTKYGLELKKALGFQLDYSYMDKWRLQYKNQLEFIQIPMAADGKSWDLAQVNSLALKYNPMGIA